MTSSATRSRTTPTPGRPRLTEPRRRGTTGREEILDAAAELFVRHGYSGTSTRMIAEAVGIRQASMYHYFKNKDDILATLLDSTVLASLDHARTLLTADGPALARLLDLTRFDSQQLVDAEWNLGSLYLLPEVADDRYADFRSARIELADCYETLAIAAIGNADDPRRLLPFRLVESVIMVRSDEERRELADRTAAEFVDTIIEAISAILK
ncbi:TetR/AcrR family transcriptional regulator [Gordonia sp. NB41Y]|uniref:TetR/AcrR family transcriptional regulator n=1 Tax=Gordonia sp. NB41Y TaxID=875808 RepID=UPI0006B2186B|nr:TetR/AcrR family transcriptional regulator [Gordonia sp. NB41Y]EMP12417.2 TetR family transcriptional regulator [Gordonia sp. NB41Y]WLP92018.1 TetR/AcrR family transcriptional regulator [Gordonia sp. NB41Y]